MLRRLSPTEGDFLKKYYMYIVAIISFAEKEALANILVRLRSKSIDIVSRDEEQRRVVARIPTYELPYMLEMVRSYAKSASFEFKAIIRRKIDIKKLIKNKKEIIVGYEDIGKVKLLVLKCTTGCSYVEIKGRELLLKYCRCPLVQLTLPSQLPPVLCSYTYPTDDIIDAYENAKKCFENVVSVLGNQFKL